MITAILITAMICMTLLIISKYGVNIKVDKRYHHIYKDETSYQTVPQNGEDIELKNLIKGEESKSVDDFVNATATVYKDYFTDEEEKPRG